MYWAVLLVAHLSFVLALLRVLLVSSGPWKCLFVSLTAFLQILSNIYCFG